MNRWLHEYERQRVWREVRRDVWLMVLCAAVLGFTVGQAVQP